MARAIRAWPASSGWMPSMASRSLSPLIAVVKASVEVSPNEVASSWTSRRMAWKRGPISKEGK